MRGLDALFHLIKISALFELTELFRLSEDSVEAAARFRAIREAFLVLADSERRAAYDERLREGGRRAQEI